ncbi:MAG: hypothetical protein P4L43_15465 [Syntrophobacteraceae bacterium]|nr:hypothetical protein [Syntrophobacteraceae bacterium]
MKLKDVVVLKEAVDDLNDSKAFYEQNESGLGEYFWDSLLADIESLAIHAGVHVREHGFVSNAFETVSLRGLLRNCR